MERAICLLIPDPPSLTLVPFVQILSHTSCCVTECHGIRYAVSSGGHTEKRLETPIRNPSQTSFLPTAGLSQSQIHHAEIAHLRNCDKTNCRSLVACETVVTPSFVDFWHESINWFSPNDETSPPSRTVLRMKMSLDVVRPNPIKSFHAKSRSREEEGMNDRWVTR